MTLRHTTTLRVVPGLPSITAKQHLLVGGGVYSYILPAGLLLTPDTPSHKIQASTKHSCPNLGLQ